jgi:UDP:flavonoid glycosyltransferase YjiC (YdhE family)
VIEALRPLARTIVVATAGRRCDVSAAPGLRIVDFLPGDVIAAKASVVVCNGGSPTTMQALANGVPVIGVASNLDQILNMGYIEQFGAGVLVRGDRLQTSVVRRAGECMLDEAHYRQRAETLQKMFGSVEPLFNDALRTLIAMRLPKGAAPASDSRVS